MLENIVATGQFSLEIYQCASLYWELQDSYGLHLSTAMPVVLKPWGLQYATKCLSPSNFSTNF